MATLPPVRIAMLPKGDYNSTAAYGYLDVIGYGGALWCCIEENGATAGQSPSSYPAKWQRMTESGVVNDGGSSSDF